MKNFEKYKTAEERAHAYDRFCEARFDKVSCCAKCELQKTHLNARTGSVCPIAWLDLEAEEEKCLPCPFCGDECVCSGGYVECLNDNCCYSSGNRKRSDAVAIAAHNRVARAAMKEKEEHDDQ